MGGGFRTIMQMKANNQMSLAPSRAHMETAAHQREASYWVKHLRHFLLSFALLPLALSLPPSCRLFHTLFILVFFSLNIFQSPVGFIKFFFTSLVFC